MAETRTLFILRHAKSSWDNYDISDFDRPLMARGISDARSMAKRHLNDLSNLDLLISSPANRAIHTSILFSMVVGFSLDKIQLNENIYEAHETEVIDIVSAIPANIFSAMIVGHNPTFTYIANKFLSQPIDNIPTSGIVKLTFTANSWKEISKDNLLTSFFDYPKNS